MVIGANVAEVIEVIAKGLCAIAAKPHQLNHLCHHPIHHHQTTPHTSTMSAPPQDVTTGPDDPTAILDSGAMMTTIPTRLILGTPWERNIRPAPPETIIRYGNMEVEHIEQTSTIGSYQTQLVPDRHSTALIPTHDIISHGHIITFTDHRCIIEDAAGQNALRLPRTPASREWRASLYTLQLLSDLRLLQHPLPSSMPAHPHNQHPQPSTRSARLHLLPRSTTRRVMRLHKSMGHPPEDIMVQAVTSTWRNTRVTPDDIRRVFYREPCLVCILAKRNRDSHNIWKSKAPAPSPNPSPDPNTTITPSLPTDKDNQPDHTWPIGSLIYYDNVGPISPASLEGYTQLLVFRDTRSKYVFSYPVKTCNEDIFLNYLSKVLQFFTTRGFTPTTLRSDFYSTFRSALSEEIYETNHCTHQTSAPYQQWQNAAERDIQNILANMSTTIYSQDFLRADTWSYAAKHIGHASTTLSHTP